MDVFSETNLHKYFPTTKSTRQCSSTRQADAHFGWVNADMHGGSVGFLPLDPLDVDDELLTVDLHHFADLLTLVVTTDNL